jgi:hypothetical protein
MRSHVPTFPIEELKFKMCPGKDNKVGGGFGIFEDGGSCQEFISLRTPWRWAGI